MTATRADAVPTITVLPLTPLDIACGWPYGANPDAPPLPKHGDAPHPRPALERAVLPALTMSPAAVSFSGGRDSSLVLAVATHVARMHGLPDPVPITLRFPDHPATDESAWQDLVLDHLGIDERIVIELTDELDLVGDVAAEAMGRHGLLWPHNTHVHAPILAAARGGSVLTGVDGDGLLGGWRWQRAADIHAHRRGRRRNRRPADDSAGRRRARPADLPHLALARAPTPARERIARHRRRHEFAWLRPEPRADAIANVARDDVGQPTRWDERVHHYARRRYLAIARRSFELLASDHDVAIHHPLLDPGFLAALATHGGADGLGGRTGAMHLLAGDLLPAEVLARPDKAVLTGPLRTQRWHDAVAELDVPGWLAEVIDEQALRATFASPRHPAALATIVQACRLEQ